MYLHLCFFVCQANYDDHATCQSHCPNTGQSTAVGNNRICGCFVRDTYWELEYARKDGDQHQQVFFFLRETSENQSMLSHNIKINNRRRHEWSDSDASHWRADAKRTLARRRSKRARRRARGTGASTTRQRN